MWERANEYIPDEEIHIQNQQTNKAKEKKHIFKLEKNPIKWLRFYSGKLIRLFG